MASITNSNMYPPFFYPHNTGSVDQIANAEKPATQLSHKAIWKLHLSQSDQPLDVILSSREDKNAFCAELARLLCKKDYPLKSFANGGVGTDFLLRNHIVIHPFDDGTYQVRSVEMGIVEEQNESKSTFSPISPSSLVLLATLNMLLQRQHIYLHSQEAKNRLCKALACALEPENTYQGSDFSFGGRAIKLLVNHGFDIIKTPEQSYYLSFGSNNRFCDWDFDEEFLGLPEVRFSFASDVYKEGFFNRPKHIALLASHKAIKRVLADPFLQQMSGLAPCNLAQIAATLKLAYKICKYKPEQTDDSCIEKNALLRDLVQIGSNQEQSFWIQDKILKAISHWVTQEKALCNEGAIELNGLQSAIRFVAIDDAWNSALIDNQSAILRRLRDFPKIEDHIQIRLLNERNCRLIALQERPWTQSAITRLLDLDIAGFKQAVVINQNCWRNDLQNISLIDERMLYAAAVFDKMDYFTGWKPALALLSTIEVIEKIKTQFHSYKNLGLEISDLDQIRSVLTFAYWIQVAVFEIRDPKNKAVKSELTKRLIGQIMRIITSLNYLKGFFIIPATSYSHATQLLVSRNSEDNSYRVQFLDTLKQGVAAEWPDCTPNDLREILSTMVVIGDLDTGLRVLRDRTVKSRDREIDFWGVEEKTQEVENMGNPHYGAQESGSCTIRSIHSAILKVILDKFSEKTGAVPFEKGLRKAIRSEALGRLLESESFSHKHLGDILNWNILLNSGLNETRMRAKLVEYSDLINDHSVKTVLRIQKFSNLPYEFVKNHIEKVVESYRYWYEVPSDGEITLKEVIDRVDGVHKFLQEYFGATQEHLDTLDNRIINHVEDHGSDENFYLDMPDMIVNLDIEHPIRKAYERNRTSLAIRPQRL